MAYEEAGLDDLNTLFLQTVIRYKKQPVYVKAITNNRELVLQALENVKEKFPEISLTDSDLDFTPVPLGFANYNGNAFYLSRIPSRQYKQGLASNNLVVDCLTEGNKTALASKELKKVCNRSISSCILGKYPSLQQALKLITEGALSVAFHRQFAVDEDWNILYKTESVGSVNGDTGEVWFKRTKGYLKGVLNA